MTDFGELTPFAAHLSSPIADAQLRDAGPALVAHLADWFISNVESGIRGRLTSVRVDSGSTTGLWERRGAA